MQRKPLILAVCCLSMFIVTMDVTIVNLAMPAIRAELSPTENQTQWVIDVYTLTMASLLLSAGAAGDRWGRRRVFQIGLVVFAVGSLLCSLAPTIAALIAARFVQSIGASMLNPSALSIISAVFVDRGERARALGVWGAVVGASMAAGPPVGGLLIDGVGWRAVFWINLPICLIALLLTVVVLPESRAAAAPRSDPAGQLFAVLALSGLVFTLIEGPHRGWTDPVVVTAASVGVVAAVAFSRHAARRESPFIDMRFFRSVPFASATAVTMLTFTAWGAFLLMMALYLQEVRLETALRSAVILLPIAIGALVFAPLSGRLVARVGSRPPLLGSGSAIAIGSALMIVLTPTTPSLVLMAICALFGIGYAMAGPPAVSASLAGMPPDRAAMAAAINSTSKQVGVSIGVALCGVLASGALRLNPPNFTTDARPLWFACAAMGVAIAVLGVVSTSSRAVSGPAPPRS